MILHATDAVQEGLRKIVLRTDVLVLVKALGTMLKEQEVQHVEVWDAMGTGSHLCYIAAHQISNQYSIYLQNTTPSLAKIIYFISCHFRSKVPNFSTKLSD